jgi:hypothetical protein
MKIWRQKFYSQNVTREKLSEALSCKKGQSRTLTPSSHCRWHTTEIETHDPSKQNKINVPHDDGREKIRINKGTRLGYSNVMKNGVIISNKEKVGIGFCNF